MKISIRKIGTSIFQASIRGKRYFCSGIGTTKKKAILDVLKSVKPDLAAAQKKAATMNEVQAALGNKLFELENPTVTFKKAR